MAGKTSGTSAAKKDTASTTGKAADTDTASAAKDVKDQEQKDTTTNDQGGVSNDDVKATGDADNTSSDQSDIEDAASAASDQVREDIAAEQAAVEENPEHPEEAIETAYLVGGEVPANAPGTEGLERE